jgi:hypothetical protein
VYLAKARSARGTTPRPMPGPTWQRRGRESAAMRAAQKRTPRKYTIRIDIPADTAESAAPEAPQSRAQLRAYRGPQATPLLGASGAAGAQGKRAGE